MAEVLKMKARDELVRLTERELERKFGELHAKQQSIAATKFYIREIHNPVATVIDDDDIDLGVVDGGNDLGCDFIHSDDGRVLIIQSKYRGQGTSEKTEEITRFRNVLKSFRDPKQTSNGRLADALANIDWENDQFELVFITFGKINDQARAVSEQTPDYPADVLDLDERCDWKFLDETDINVELRNARSVAAGVSAKPFSLFPMGAKGQRGHSVISVAAGKQRSYVMTLDANQLVNAYKALGQDAIFSLNIRNYVGKTRTNKQIVETARRDPENFYMFNNGISCLATKVTVTDNAVEVIGLQVINGAQTIRSLVHVGKFGSQLPFVLVRITEIAEGYGSGGKIREQITRFNNTQNTIKLSDFRSNDPVQSTLAEQFKLVVRNGKNPDGSAATPLHNDNMVLAWNSKASTLSSLTPAQPPPLTMFGRVTTAGPVIESSSGQRRPGRSDKPIIHDWSHPAVGPGDARSPPWRSPRPGFAEHMRDKRGLFADALVRERS
jgi:hypothetical protein